MLFVPLGSLAAGCASPVPESAESARVPSEWGYEEEAPVVAPLGHDAFEAAFAEALDEVMTLDPAVGFDAYDAKVAFGDETCPWYDPGFETQRYWEDDCETAAGASFHGWALYNRLADVGQPDGSCGQIAFMYAFGRVEDPDGGAFAGYGELDLQECATWDGERATFWGLLRGGFGDDGASGTWLSRPLTLDLSVTAAEDHGVRALALAGGLSGLSGGLLALDFEDFALSDDPAACALEPPGRVWAMDRATATYAIQFDAVGPGDAACDGCGAWTIDGADAGEVCFDAGRLLGWGERPWG